MKTCSIIALEDFPLVKNGDNIAHIIAEACKKNGLSLEDGDIIVVAQKIFSKTEKRIVNLRTVVPSAKAKELARKTGKNPRFVELVLQETKKVLKATRQVLLVEDRRGLVCINAGIDKSNVEGRGSYALLPQKPDQSAEKCRREVMTLTGKRIAIVICDTYSRPFRRGQVNFAIGMAGAIPFKDYRGKKDLFGQVLKVKNTAIVDEIAAAAELLMGQGKEGTPVVILRGFSGFVEWNKDHSIDELGISRRQDLFRGVL